MTLHGRLVSTFIRLLVISTLVMSPAIHLGPALANPLDEHAAAELYVSAGPVANTLTGYDGTTLEPRAGRSSPMLDGASEQAVPVLSADGSTLAYLANTGEIVVRDGLMGTDRLRIVPHASIGELALSRNGRRLVAFVMADYSEANLPAPAWKVYDTADGHLITQIGNEEPGDPWELWAVDANALRLYRLVYAADASASNGPWSTRLIAGDLTSGAEIGRLDLPEVRAGFWQDSETVKIGGGEEPLMRMLEPALAVSPDGGQLAIVHADDDTMTFIDAATLTIERTVAIALPVSRLSRLWGWLALAPRTAAAKALDGTMRRAIFSTDGTRLFVYGDKASVEEGEPIFRGLGISAVEVASGKISARVDDEDSINRVVPSPDGESLYVASSDAAGGFRIRRLAGERLETIAEQSFTTWRWFLVRSARADPDLPLTIELVDMAFVPADVTVPAGIPVRLTIANHGNSVHEFRAGDAGSDGWQVTIELQPGETRSVTIDAPAGQYKMICDRPGHAAAGMGGVLFAR